MNMPQREGFFWGQWRIKGPGTYPVCSKCGTPLYPGEDENETPGQEWEVMHVVSNGDGLAVMVPGVGHWQSIENFFWDGEACARGCDGG